MSVYVEQPEQVSPQLKDIGLGIDLGVKDFAVISNGIVKKNINKTAKLKKVEKQFKTRIALPFEEIRKLRRSAIKMKEEKLLDKISESK